MHKIVVLGGYGNFGKRICESLAEHPGIHLTIAGRHKEKAEALCDKLHNQYPDASIEALALDINSINFETELKAAEPDIVIHTSGPFQGQNYKVPECCINAGAHYIDLADDRRFVCDIKNLNTPALDNNVLIVSGASSVPGLSSAVVNEYLIEFKQLDEIDFAIIPGKKAGPGLATVQGALATIGRPFKSLINNEWKDIYSWLDVRHLNLGEHLGKRWLANVDIPDLELFPQHYPGLRTVRFQAGLEFGLLHNTMVCLALFTKMGVVNNWVRHARIIHRLSCLFDSFGTDTGGMVISLRGISHRGEKLSIHWKLLARDGVGPYIPTLPAILIAQKLVNAEISITRAFPCLGFFSLKEFSEVARRWDIYHETEQIVG